MRPALEDRFGLPASGRALAMCLLLAASWAGLALEEDVADPESAMCELVETAVTDLAGRLGLERASIEVVSAQPVTWPDASLGCPLPGMGYRQVPEDGYRILLRAGGQEYAYHGGARRGPFLCAEPSGPPAAPGP